ncbi:carboxypeptidase cpdS precursor [Aaosphaeria arxii CBS 175.79]|uniref:Carboxypeptidase n=1 Tax=Aaosphaeria arxii CBS 175.79 TaxID=1450172 RepID=A0A6A5YAX0_9PLEO|nr:carboxypeptidase cpdS precursor [Aaosphaeria arxii CBS 175.79]KAF2022386.1 carboxypeptidase cpdS precursor [Aaosphaeria arxii CBS 175.79]
MRFSSSVLLCGLLGSAAAARSPRYAGKKIDLPRSRAVYSPPRGIERREEDFIIAQNDNTKKFAVNGTAGAIPNVDFDIGESYAGLLPISDSANETSELYFWFFPSANPDASEEITIWLNGGPGCSSLEGFLQENGPISWQYGTYKPIYNPWNWANLTNMVWVEQPVGTGFTQGKPTANSTEEAAQEFLGFFKNFVDTFGLQDRKVFIAGESYAGKYIPYFADAMLEKNDTKYYDVKGIMVYDPSVASDALLEDVPAVAYVDHWKQLFNLNSTFTESIHERADKCGYTDYLEKYLTFPPSGPLPEPTSPKDDPSCALWNDITDAVLLTNPCFDIYQIATTCPLLWDVLGFPGSIGYLPEGAEIYFNRTEVQKAINAPIQEWAECSDGVLDTDNSIDSGLEVLPRVIDALDRTVIVHGELDWILLGNGTLLTIQNMTWGGQQGFQCAPEEEFYVPYHEEVSLGSISASGIMGLVHTERKLTFVDQRMSGHMVPQYQPSSGYRQLEFLLGRIDSLTSRVPFTTRPNEVQPSVNATMKRDVAVGLESFKKWY